jgi:hypothetical protein
VASSLVMQKGKSMEFCVPFKEKTNSVSQMPSKDSFLDLWPVCSLPHVQMY